MRLIFIGPPGVGKGTQAKKLCDHFGILHLSTGEILREEISHNSTVGQAAKQFIDHGKLVPDSILLDIMSTRLSQRDCENGYCLDGFPRTIPQAKGLEVILKRLHQSINAVISIEADEKELINRLVLRGKNSGRTDDTSNVIKKRLFIYRNQTAPLIDYYTRKKLLQSIDGMGEISEITKRILDILS
ncbi:MAG: adenylate kinase [Fidelibacterota bacterium]